MTLSRLVPGAVALTPRLRRVLGALSAVMLAGLAARLTYTTTGIGGHVADAVGNRRGHAVFYSLSDPPFPSPADVGWLALYPARTCVWG